MSSVTKSSTAFQVVLEKTSNYVKHDERPKSAPKG